MAPSNTPAIINRHLCSLSKSGDREREGEERKSFYFELSEDWRQGETASLAPSNVKTQLPTPPTFIYQRVASPLLHMQTKRDIKKCVLCVVFAAAGGLTAEVGVLWPGLG